VTNNSSPSDPSSSQQNLESLHKELIEARNLAIKTDNLVKNLGAEIKQIARRQDTYQRRYLLNSAVAYVLFVVVIFTGLYLAFDAKLSSAQREVEHYTARNTALEERLEEAERDLQLRRDSQNRAYAFFELLEHGDPDEVVEQFTELQAQITDRAMIELLRDRVEEINYNLAEQAFREGLGYMSAENWSDARDAFLKSLNHVERTPWQPELDYNLGDALFNLGDYEGALYYFDEALSAEDLDEAHQAMARYRRAMCLESTGRLAEAVQAYQEYRDRHSSHRYTGRALHRINSIQRELERNSEEEE